MNVAKSTFNPEKVLMNLSDAPLDSWTVDDAMKGISIIGGTGSGKTTASGKAIALSFLNEGWGGLVLCAKMDEAELWKQYCKKAGRLDDLIIFEKNSPYIFNPIDYENKREGEGKGETQNLTNIFMNIYRMGNRIASEGDTKEERYWDTALKRCLNRVIELLKFAGEDLGYYNMVKIINSAPNFSSKILTDRMKEYEDDEEFPNDLNADKDYCLKCFLKVFERHLYKKEPSDELKQILGMVESYFAEALPTMGSRTKSVVTESFMGLAEPFLSGLLLKHFAGATNIFPEWTFEKNKIIVLNFPIKEYLDAGIIAQCVFKLSFQQAVERRNADKHLTPVFLWCDEAQYFVNPYDQIFLTTARSSRTATVYLSQNISNYFAVMGSGSDAKARVDSLMGNLSTKIFHANTDAETNEYASRLIGNTVSTLANASNQQSVIGLNYSHSEGVSSQYLPQVQPREFTVLKTGGKINNFQVYAVLVETGRQWVNGKNYLKISFTQNFNENE